MPSTREIRQRIKSVNNIAKITNAMQLIAASKMRVAQRRVLASREYAHSLLEISGRLARSLEDDVKNQFPLLAERSGGKSLIVLITPNRGLAGALVGNILRVALQEIKNRGDKRTELVALGRKGERFAVRSHWELGSSFELGDAPAAGDVQSVAEYLMRKFNSQEVDEVSLVYANFVNTAVQKPGAMRLLPVSLPAEASADERDIHADALYEPNIHSLLGTLLPRYVATELYQAVLEAVASEHSARMVAMRNATDNAQQLNGELTLEYNKARQEYITSELLDIVGGAVALAA